MQASSTSDITTVTIIVGLFGALVTVIQVLGLYILGDIRSRVARLEGFLMTGKKE